MKPVLPASSQLQWAANGPCLHRRPPPRSSPPTTGAALLLHISIFLIPAFDLSGMNLVWRILKPCHHLSMSGQGTAPAKQVWETGKRQMLEPRPRLKMTVLKTQQYLFRFEEMRKKQPAGEVVEGSVVVQIPEFPIPFSPGNIYFQSTL